MAPDKALIALAHPEFQGGLTAAKDMHPIWEPQGTETSATLALIKEQDHEDSCR
jgi:hypothetical protein